MNRRQLLFAAGGAGLGVALSMTKPVKTLPIATCGTDPRFSQGARICAPAGVMHMTVDSKEVVVPFWNNVELGSWNDHAA